MYYMDIYFSYIHIYRNIYIYYIYVIYICIYVCMYANTVPKVGKPLINE